MVLKISRFSRVRNLRFYHKGHQGRHEGHLNLPSAGRPLIKLIYLINLIRGEISRGKQNFSLLHVIVGNQLFNPASYHGNITVRDIGLCCCDILWKRDAVSLRLLSRAKMIKGFTGFLTVQRSVKK
jgi:hypothetical protein